MPLLLEKPIDSNARATRGTTSSLANDVAAIATHVQAKFNVVLQPFARRIPSLDSALMLSKDKKEALVQLISL